MVKRQKGGGKNPYFRFEMAQKNFLKMFQLFLFCFCVCEMGCILYQKVLEDSPTPCRSSWAKGLNFKYIFTLGVGGTY